MDPWRQGKPPAPEKKKKPLHGIEEPTPDTEVPERCVVWEGHGAGVNVWVEGDDENSKETALARVRELFKALHGLKQADVTDILRYYAINPDGEASAVLPAHVAAHALRRVLVSSPQGAALMAKYRVKAFVK